MLSHLVCMGKIEYNFVIVVLPDKKKCIWNRKTLACTGVWTSREHKQ